MELFYALGIIAGIVARTQRSSGVIESPTAEETTFERAQSLTQEYLRGARVDSVLIDSEQCVVTFDNDYFLRTTGGMTVARRDNPFA